MPQFAIYAREILVGHSVLEHGDPPMGVAFGVFIPNAAYATIRHECQTNHADQSSLHLSAQTESGVQISCVGVSILDYSAELDPPYVEVNVLGIPYPLYGELFPHHVARYDQQFPNENLVISLWNGNVGLAHEFLVIFHSHRGSFDFCIKKAQAYVWQ